MRTIDLSDTDYAGSLSLQRNMPSSSRRTRGKVRGNKAAPRTYTVALTPVTDSEGNVLTIGRRRRMYAATPKVAATPSETRAPMTYADRLAMFGASSDMD